MSATAWVSAAEPDLQHQIVSWTLVSLSVTRLAMYAPVVVLESAPAGGKSVSSAGDQVWRYGKLRARNRTNTPRMTPSLNVTAMLSGSTGQDLSWRENPRHLRSHRSSQARVRISTGRAAHRPWVLLLYLPLL